MHTTTLIAAAATLVGMAAATRNGTDVRDFIIYPQQDCKQQGFDLCDPNVWSQLPSSMSSLVDTIKASLNKCSNGKMCLSGICGHFVGKDNMCCGGKGAHMSFNEVIGMDNLTSTVTEMRDACVPYINALKDYDVKKGDKPLTSGCQNGTNKTMNYPVGLTMQQGQDFFQGGGQVNVNQCCSVDQDAITVYNGLFKDVDTAVCIPPVGAGDPKLTANDAAGKKSGAAGMAPAMLLALAFAGLTTAGVL